MNALEILERCRGAGVEIKNLELSLSLRQDVVRQCNAQGCGVPDAIMNEIVKLSCDLDQRRRRYAVELCAGTWIVDALPYTEKKVIRGWYLEGKSMGQLVDELHYAPTSIKRYRKRGQDRCRKMPMDTIQAILPEWYE